MIAVRFLPVAEDELLRELAYYSRARRGTGIRFQASIERAIQRAARHPLGGAPSIAHTRSILVKGFPFSVVYRVESEQLVIVAVAPHRKRPNYWAIRLD